LVIVTGDHETGYLTGATGVYGDVVNNGKGVMPTMTWNSTNHTNQLVPFFAKGAGAELLTNYANGSDPVKGAYLDNTEIPLAIRNLIK
jgi:alkaline phosphatase